MLSKNSAQALLDGLHPLPRVEFEFWDARLMNLKYIHEQVMALLPPVARHPQESQPSRGDPGNPDGSLSASLGVGQASSGVC